VLKTYENPRLTAYIVADFIEAIKKQGIDISNLCIVTPEVRGVAAAAIVANLLGVPLVHIRKIDKIPGPVLTEEYANAYSKEILQISEKSDVKGRDVVFIDDGIASGGTTFASCKLIEKLGGNVRLVAAMIDHKYKTKLAELEKYNVYTIFDFQDNKLVLNKEAPREPVQAARMQNK
jgi:adenine phosphoribosyltransferase